MTTLAPLLHLAALLAAVSPIDDEPKVDPPPPPLAARFEALKRKYIAREKSFYEELTAANSLEAAARDKKITDENERFWVDHRAINDEVRALIRANRADPAALEGLILLPSVMNSFLDDDLVQIVRDHFLNDPRMGMLCADLRIDGPQGDLLSDVSRDHSDRAVRAQAAYSLALGRRFAAEKRAGSDEAARDANLKRAEEGFRRVVAEFSDVDSADGAFRLADRARAELDRIANLPNLVVGKVAPEIVGEGLDGRPLKLSDHRGKVVVLVFWATWCGPCMAMVPHERELYERMRGRPFALLGVNGDSDEDREKVHRTVAEKEMAWPSWWDGSRLIQTAYDVPHWPRIFVIDPTGVIRHIDVRGEKLDRAVDELLSEAGLPEPTASPR